MSFLTTSQVRVSPLATILEPSNYYSVNKAWNSVEEFLATLKTKGCYWFMGQKHGMGILQYEKSIPLRKSCPTSHLNVECNTD